MDGQCERCGRYLYDGTMYVEIERLRAELAAYKRVVDAARAVISNPAYQGICDEDVELEQAVAALAAKGE